jgi:hypothetical protein
MSRWLDEKETAMYARILDITFTLSSEFLSQVCRVLILDVLDNRIPATFPSVMHLLLLYLLLTTCRCWLDHRNREYRQCSIVGVHHFPQWLFKKIRVNIPSRANFLCISRTVWNGLNFSSRAHRLIGSKSALGIDKMRCEDGVNQGWLSETGLAYEGRM